MRPTRSSSAECTQSVARIEVVVVITEDAEPWNQLPTTANNTSISDVRDMIGCFFEMATSVCADMKGQNPDVTELAESRIWRDGWNKPMLLT
jgi:hypothetical protein